MKSAEFFLFCPNQQLWNEKIICLSLFQRRSAVGAAGSFQGNFAFAVGADLHYGGGLIRFGFFQITQPVDSLDNQKQHQGNKQEVYDSGNKRAVLQHIRVIFPQPQGKPGKIYAACKQAQQGLTTEF